MRILLPLRVQTLYTHASSTLLDRGLNPDAVCRSDAAPELIKAIRELGWLP